MIKIKVAPKADPQNGFSVSADRLKVETNSLLGFRGSVLEIMPIEPAKGLYCVAIASNSKWELPSEEMRDNAIVQWLDAKYRSVRIVDQKCFIKRISHNAEATISQICEEENVTRDQICNPKIHIAEVARARNRIFQNLSTYMGISEIARLFNQKSARAGRGVYRT